MRTAYDGSLVLKDGRTLGYAEYGDPLGTPILVFHGTPGSRREGALFDRAAQAHHARILVADRPGYVISSPLRHGTLLGYVEDVVAFADALQLERFTVLGASGGGPFALACAAMIPERVRRCGLMSAVGPITLPRSMNGMILVNRFCIWLARRSPGLVGTLVARQSASSRKKVQKYLNTGTSPLADVPPEVFALLMADQQEARRVGGTGVTFDFRILPRAWDFPLEHIRPPVLLWHGAADNLAPLALARYMAEHIPGAVLKVLPKASHLGTYACTDEIVATLVRDRDS